MYSLGDGDEWPLPYEYLGRPTSWQRITRVFGAPIPHTHGCPDCYEHVPCLDRCSLEPDLEEDGVPSGGFMTCDRCHRWKEVNDNALLLGA
jgi:hypothetical protein